MLNNKLIKQFREYIEYALKEYVGGEKYFDKVDDFVKCNPDFIKVLTTQATYPIITTGEFGRLIQSKVNVVYCAPGGLRKGNKCNIPNGLLKDKYYTIVDDSYYSGKTIEVIDKELRKHGAQVKEIIVAYDGSKEKREYVKSLYRYYDEKGGNNYE